MSLFTEFDESLGNSATNKFSVKTDAVPRFCYIIDVGNTQTINMSGKTDKNGNPASDFDATSVVIREWDGKTLGEARSCEIAHPASCRIFRSVTGKTILMRWEPVGNAMVPRAVDEDTAKKVEKALAEDDSVDIPF